MIQDIEHGLSGIGRPVVGLHGGLKLEEQVRAIASSPGHPRVIVSTNLAETSLTVEGGDAGGGHGAGQADGGGWVKWVAEVGGAAGGAGLGGTKGGASGGG